MKNIFISSVQEKARENKQRDAAVSQADGMEGQKGCLQALNNS